MTEILEHDNDQSILFHIPTRVLINIRYTHVVLNLNKFNLMFMCILCTYFYANSALVKA